MDYHFYVIDQGENGQLEIEADFIHQELCCSYGGNKEKLWPILKDIYLYYGISREDTKQKTERYRMLESILVASPARIPCSQSSDSSLASSCFRLLINISVTW